MDKTSFRLIGMYTVPLNVNQYGFTLFIPNFFALRFKTREPFRMQSYTKKEVRNMEKTEIQIPKIKETSRFDKTLEHVTDHYVIFAIIGQFACFAHQNYSFWWAKQVH